MAFRASSYSRYTGAKSKRPAWVPVMVSTWSRGWKSKWVRRITTGSLFLALAITLALYALNVAIPDWRGIAESLGEMGVGGGRNFEITNATYLGLLNLYIHPFLLPLSLLFGYDLIAGDLRTNALEAYFARPLTPWGYLLGRTAAYTGFLLAVTLVPMLWIWLFDVSTGPDGHFADVARVPFGMTAAMTLVALTMSLLIQAITAITRSGLWTNLVLLVVFFFSGGMGAILQEVTDEPEMGAIAFWNDIYVVSAGFMGVDHEISEHLPSFGLALSVLVFLCGGSLLILIRALHKRTLVG